MVYDLKVNNAYFVTAMSAVFCRGQFSNVSGCDYEGSTEDKDTDFFRMSDDFCKFIDAMR